MRVQLTESEFRTLKGIYTSLTNPANYGSPANLKKASGLPMKKIRLFLESSKVYTKFRGSRQKFPRLKVRSLGIKHIWSLDVAFMETFSKENNGVQFLLIAVDVLSRFLRIQPMTSRTANCALEPFKKMINPHNPITVPVKVWTDQGKEFKGSFKKFCNYLKIGLHSTYGESKSAIAERYVRTVKNILYKFFEEYGSCRYIPHLQKFVKLINSRVHSTIGMPSDKVSEKDVKRLITMNSPHAFDEARIGRKNLNIKRRTRSRQQKFKKGQSVRLSYQRKPFDKGYKQRFTDELFTVCRVSVPRSKFEPITYVLKDKENEEILGRFYASELVPYRYDETRHRARH